MTLLRERFRCLLNLKVKLSVENLQCSHFCALHAASSSSTFLKDVAFKVCVMVHKNTVAADLILVAIGTKLEQMLLSVLEK